MNPVLISIIALVVSFSSFSLAVFQFRHNQRISKLVKINEVIAKVFDLKKASADLKYLIERTDDIDPNDEIFAKIHLLTESAVSVLNSPKVKSVELYHVEQHLLQTRIDFDLYVMQINERIRFEKEVQDFESSKNAS